MRQEGSLCIHPKLISKDANIADLRLFIKYFVRHDTEKNHSIKCYQIWYFMGHSIKKIIEKLKR